MAKRRKQKPPPYVMIEQKMLKSEAWRRIGNASRVAYIHIRARFFWPPSGEQELLHKDMEEIMDHKTFAKAIRDLEKNGFISRSQQGGLYRRRNKFRISEEWKVSRGEIPPVRCNSRGEIPLIQGEKFPLLGK